MARKGRRPVGETIGGMMVGFDYQIFRAGKPPAEMVESAKPIPPVPATDGGTIEVGPAARPRDARYFTWATTDRARAS